MSTQETTSPGVGTLPEAADTDTVTVSKEDIQRVVERIVRELKPEKVILFGSRANGESHDLSDVDILVVMETDRPKYHRRSQVSRILRGRGFPMDIVVYTPEEFAEAVNHQDYYYNPFIKDIIEEGVVLYDRTA